MVSIVQFHPESNQPGQYIPVVQLNTVGAVSYTHLDVYKRQVYEGLPRWLFPIYTVKEDSG